jgi:glycine/D-amino acid oxidase-like deaminating enzyme
MAATTADAIVIGGGMAGASGAAELARYGRVIVLKTATIGPDRFTRRQ